MGSTRYIKKANGQLAGSLPGSMPVPPTPQPILGSAPVAAAPAPSSVDSAHAAFARRKADAKNEGWMADAPFPTLNAVIQPDYAVLTDYEVLEDERTRGDRSRSVLTKQETAQLLLRAEQVQYQPGAPGNWRAVYVYPAYGSAEGVRLATQVRKGDFGSSQQSGVYTDEGEFIPDADRFTAILSERIGEPGCPLHDEMEGAVESYDYRTRSTRDYEVTGLYIRATAEPVDLPDNALEDPDSAWDSRFD